MKTRGMALLLSAALALTLALPVFAEAGPLPEAAPETAVEAEPQPETAPETAVETEPQPETAPETAVEAEPQPETAPETAAEEGPQFSAASEAVGEADLPKPAAASALPQLPAADQSEMHWNKNNGDIRFKLPQEWNGKFKFDVVRETATPNIPSYRSTVLSGGHADAVDAEGYSIIHAGPMFGYDGTYTFTLQGLGDGTTTANSEIVESEAFDYEVPDVKLDTPRDLSWDGNILKFTLPKDSCGYRVRWYAFIEDNSFVTGNYNIIYDDWEILDSSLTQDQEMVVVTVPYQPMDKNKINRISVQALSGDLENVGHSDESEKIQLSEQGQGNLLQQIRALTEGLQGTTSYDSAMEFVRTNSPDIIMQALTNQELYAAYVELENALNAKRNVEVTVRTNAGAPYDRCELVGLSLNAALVQDGRVVAMTDSGLTVTLEQSSPIGMLLDTDVDILVRFGLRESASRGEMTMIYTGAPILVTVPVPEEVRDDVFQIRIYYPSGNGYTEITPAVLDGGQALRFHLPEPNSFIVAKPGTVTPLNEQYFPDEAFRKYLADSWDKAPADQKLSASERRANSQLRIDNKNIRSLQGISYFTDISSIIATGNKLTEIDLHENKWLYGLNLSGNKLTKLDLSANPLIQNLYISGNSIAALDLSNLTSLTAEYTDVGIESGSQTIRVPYKKTGDRSYEIDLKQLLTAEQLTHVHGATCQSGPVVGNSVDIGADGIIRIGSDDLITDTGIEFIPDVIYRYATGNANVPELTVRLLCGAIIDTTNHRVDGISAGTTQEALQEKLGPGVEIKDRNGDPLKATDKVGTGCQIKLPGQEEILRVMIPCDVDGTGVIDLFDLIESRKAVLDVIQLTDVFLEAAQVSGSSGTAPNLFDIIALRKVLLNVNG